ERVIATGENEAAPARDHGVDETMDRAAPVPHDDNHIPTEDEHGAAAPGTQAHAGEGMPEARGDGRRRGGRGRGRDREREPREDAAPMVDDVAGRGTGDDAETPALSQRVEERAIEQPRPRADEQWQAEAPPRAAMADAGPYALPLDSLVAVAEAAGLQWVNSDAGKIEAAQQALAAVSPPTHARRETPAAAIANEGPLVLVETKKDLSQVKLPFETMAPDAPGRL
ncbi:MAG: hypothetical protein ABI364_03615, partial [Caldimonas sp.]